ncbi:MAG: translation initiation factor IF-2 [Lachnospiraceae bacterium]|jgi:translation initiation factor IF-2|nr:translation initiation factor IF-2 [Lachnospiraceae bacterium]
MSKVKVYELAKELDKTSKELVEFLQSKGREVKSMSGLEEEEAGMVRAAFSGTKKEDSKEKTVPEKIAQPESDKTPETPAEPPKKKSIVTVFRPQNTQNAQNAPRGKQRNARPQTQGTSRSTPQGAARTDNSGRERRLVMTSEYPGGGRPSGDGRRPINAGERASGTRPIGAGGRPVSSGRPGERPRRPLTREEILSLRKPEPEVDLEALIGSSKPSDKKKPVKTAKPVEDKETKNLSEEVKTQQNVSETTTVNETPEANKTAIEKDVTPSEKILVQDNEKDFKNQDIPTEAKTEKATEPLKKVKKEESPARQSGGTGARSDRPAAQQRSFRSDRPAGERSNFRSDRPAGERSNYRSDRPAGERGNFRSDRPAGERSNYRSDRPAGERSNFRSDRPAGERSNFRSDRPPGERSNYRSDRPAGERGTYRSDRPAGERSNFRSDRPSFGDRTPKTDRTGAGISARPERPGLAEKTSRTERDGAFSKRKGAGTQGEAAKPKRKGIILDKDKEKNKAYLKDDDGRVAKSARRPAPAAKQQASKPAPRPVKIEDDIKSIIIPEYLTIQELADKMKVVPSAIVKKLFLQGKIVTVNQEIDYATAEEIALEFNILSEKEVVVDVIEELLKEDDEAQEKLEKRPPVVCVMGHVDHGKTSLLDAIRHTHVIDKEAGGITQHIGAYVVEINGEKITFLDTPGHEAFTAMRMRGANSTDIAILVVAADDGVKPQTIEAINHAKAAGIEIVVAINKIDKPGANVEKVKQELTEYELIPEDWGGSTIFVPVSAKTGEGLENLMEMLLLAAEVLELKANPDRRARGLVIEAELDKGKGAVATVLVQKGTLRVGDAIAAGSAFGKVRAMMDDKGRKVKEAKPSMPVEILGLNDVPDAGDVFVAFDNDKEARNFGETFIAQNRVKLIDDTKKQLSLDDLFTQIKEGNLKELGIIVKADVQGSVEAVKQSLLKLSNEEVVVKVIHGAVGAINESDVSLASASNAIIIGFNVRPDATAKETAEREKVDIRLYRVIYNAIDDIEAAMKGMLDPVYEEKVLGHAEIRQTFKASGVGTIGGSYVLDGTFERDCQVRITRDGIVIFEGPLASLKRFKDDVKEVRAGYECGFVFTNFNDIKEGDMVESFKMVEIPR